MFIDVLRDSHKKYLRNNGVKNLTVGSPAGVAGCYETVLG